MILSRTREEMLKMLRSCQVAAQLEPQPQVFVGGQGTLHRSSLTVRTLDIVVASRRT